MKRIMLLPLLLALALSCSACGGGGEAVDGEYLLYFTADDKTHHGSALDTERYDAENCTAFHPQDDACPNPGDLVRALLAGPRQENLSSPFPRGVTLQSWEWDQERPGNLCVSLSEQYSGLTDVSLTLADYSIVLTLAQLQGVESVEIRSDGHTSNYRSHQLLAAEEAVLHDAAAGG